MNTIRTAKSFLVIAALTAVFIGAAMFTAGCKTTRTLPDGTTVREFDPVKTENVKAAVEPLVTSALRRAIASDPNHKAQNATYLRAIGSVFCNMSSTGKFDPAYLIAAADQATQGLQAGVDPFVLDLKDGMIALYRINFNGRFDAELPPDKWPKNVADVMCSSIDTALKDSGFAGVK